MTQQKILIWIVSMLLERVTPAVGVKVLRRLMDYVRKEVVESPNTIDDAIVLPILELGDKMLVSFSPEEGGDG